MMSTEEVENLEDAVEELLMQLNENELNELANGLLIDEVKWKGKRKILVLRCVRQYIEKTLEDIEEVEKRKQFLDKIHEAIEIVQTEAEDGKGEHILKQISELPEIQGRETAIADDKSKNILFSTTQRKGIKDAAG